MDNLNVKGSTFFDTPCTNGKLTMTHLTDPASLKNILT